MVYIRMKDKKLMPKTNTLVAYKKISFLAGALFLLLSFNVIPYTNAIVEAATTYNGPASLSNAPNECWVDQNAKVEQVTPASNCTAYLLGKGIAENQVTGGLWFIDGTGAPLPKSAGDLKIVVEKYRANPKSKADQSYITTPSNYEAVTKAAEAAAAQAAGTTEIKVADCKSGEVRNPDTAAAKAEPCLPEQCLDENGQLVGGSRVELSVKINGQDFICYDKCKLTSNTETLLDKGKGALNDVNNPSVDKVKSAIGTTNNGAEDVGCSDLNKNPIIIFMKVVINVLSAGIGVILVGMVVFRGIQYQTARDNPQVTAAAIKGIWQVLLALLFYVFSYALLNFLVPGGLFR
jgi:hypothetical protein